jgi:hypothetical protein
MVHETPAERLGYKNTTAGQNINSVDQAQGRFAKNLSINVKPAVIFGNVAAGPC